MPSPLTLPPVVRPPFRKEASPLTGKHPTEEIIDTVFRVLCGYESVSEACFRKGIKPSQYYSWHDNFVEICRNWSPRRLRPPKLASAESRPATRAKPELVIIDEDNSHLLSGAYMPEDIVRWAQNRLSTAWRADCQSLRTVTQ